MAYRFLKHKITSIIPAELYFGRDLRLPTGSPPKLEGNEPNAAESNVKISEEET